MTVPASSSDTATPTPSERIGYGFGTFKGVFLPSLLTILGVIMFLRFPWVLGSVGLIGTILIVTLSVVITALTGLSIAAMATNMRVGGGGAYFMISRTLAWRSALPSACRCFSRRRSASRFTSRDSPRRSSDTSPRCPQWVITRVARWPELIVLGILGASLSSAMGALLGAPRTLQSLAQDAVLPRMLARGYGHTNDPRLATVIAFVIALLGILLGDLNAIAPILSMFFLTSYAVLNFSAGIEALIGGPAWRPTFRVPWWVSLLGFASCVAAMLMIDAGATFVALFVSGLVYHAVQRRQLRARWGDVRYGVLVLIARVVLEALARRRPDERSWNPNVLVLTGPPSSRWHLVVIGRALAGESGLLTIATVVRDANSHRAERVESLRTTIESYLESHRVPALVKVESDADIGDGLIALVKSYGFGPLVPNTVLLGQASTPDDPVKHAELLALIQRRRRNLIVLHEAEDLPTVRTARRIDIWWRGHRGNLGLMLALAFLLRKDEVWAAAEILLWRVVESEGEIASATTQLDQVLTAARFPARVQVICHDGDPFAIIRRNSRQADLLFLGLRGLGADESLADYAAYYAELSRHTDGLPPTALINAAEEVDLHRLFANT